VKRKIRREEIKTAEMRFLKSVKGPVKVDKSRNGNIGEESGMFSVNVGT
jgi:hypothetical protein